MKVIETKKAPGAIGPYSQGFEVAGMVYTSGQIPVNPENGQVPEGIGAQARQSCENVGQSLGRQGQILTGCLKPHAFWRIWQTLQNSTRCMGNILCQNQPGAVWQSGLCPRESYVRSKRLP